MDREDDRRREPGQTGPAPVAPVGPGGDRRAAAVAAVVLVLLALAVLKPWTGPSSPSPTHRPVASAARVSTTQGIAESPGRAAPSGPADPAGPDGSDVPGRTLTDPGGQCPPIPAWRAYAVQEEHGRRVVGRYAIDPVIARAPTDPAIPVVIVATGSVLSLGFCAPTPAAAAVPGASGASGAADGRAVRGWSIEPSGDVVALDLRPVDAYAPVGAAAGAVYAPPRGAADQAGGWPAATYVFEVGTASAADAARWFAVRVVRVPSLGPPGATPRTSSEPTATPAPT